MAIDKEQAARAVDAFLRALGRNPDEEPDLRDTPTRVVDAWAKELVDGYEVDVAEMIRREAIAITDADEGWVIVRGLHVVTMCPHHLLPARGTADVLYWPGPFVIGLGAIPRLLNAWSHRLTLQETIGKNVVRSFVDHLGAQGAVCRLVLSHSCLTCRGQRQTEAALETLAFAGSFAKPGAPLAMALAALGAR